MHSVSSTHNLILCFLARLGLGTLLLGAVPALAQAQSTANVTPGETYAVEVKIIEARQKVGADKPLPLDPALAPLANDLKALPFEGFMLVDSVKKELQAGEAYTLQYGTPVRRRFVRATAHGKAQGKVNLDVVMERVRGKGVKTEFKSDVSIPEGGTLVLVATRTNAPANSVVLLAISARTLPTAAAAPAAAASSAGPATPPK